MDKYSKSNNVGSGSKSNDAPQLHSKQVKIHPSENKLLQTYIHHIRNMNNLTSQQMDHIRNMTSEDKMEIIFIYNKVIQAVKEYMN
jgi:hypothetical protein